MNFFAVGSNRKDSIKGTIDPSDGDKALCDPGVNECSSFLLECFNNNIPSDGFFSRFDDQKKAVNFLNGLNSTQFSPGATRRFVEAVGCTAGTELSISHPPDALNKRFVEVWKIPYPVVLLPPVVHSSNLPVLVASDKFSLKPLVYPEEVQSITLPPGTGTFLRNPWEGIQMYNSGEKVIIYSSSTVILLEWNGVGYDQVLLHQVGSVYRASVDNNSAIVTYQDGLDYKIAFYEKSSSWALSSTSSWPYTQREVALYGSYILVGGSEADGITLNKSDLSVYYSATNANYLATVPTPYRKYPANPDIVTGYSNPYLTVGGNIIQRLVYTQYRTSSENMTIFSDAYLPSGSSSVSFDSSIFLRHPYSNTPSAGFVAKTSHGELYPYNYLYGWYSASQNLDIPDSYSGYLIDRYLVGFYDPVLHSYRVKLAYNSDELIDLYSYDFSTHKIYNGAFYPVKYPYYLTDNRDGTLKLLRIGTTHYNEIGDGVLTLKFENSRLINFTTGFSSGFDGTETCRFLISDDGVVFWKWLSPNWVVEIDPSQGNTESVFIEGCAEGFHPLSSSVLYIKVFLSSGTVDNAPTLDRPSIRLSVSYKDMSSKAILCDDLRVSVNFESPTSTKITSHDPGIYSLAGVVTVFAPPVDTDLDV